MMQLISGTRLGRYEIRSKLGAGGMGEVYLARDEKLNRHGNTVRYLTGIVDSFA